MPEAFNNCVKKGGKIRTLSLPKGKFMHICILKGKTYSGEVKMKKDMKDMQNKGQKMMNK